MAHRRNFLSPVLSAVLRCWRSLLLGALGVVVLWFGVHRLHSSPVVADRAPTAVPFYDRLGAIHHPISTRSATAQRYFDQGLTLLYGFNHGEAVRSFQAAAQLDPECAMCQWGIALALGPNINAAMNVESVPIAWNALQTALKLSNRATPAEKDYIQALKPRYQAEPPSDRRPLDQAYAQAMQTLTQRYSQDADAATLFAEAQMDTMPWSYWDNGKPKPGADAAIAAIERAIQLNPKHPGAHHYYIHLMEFSPTVQKASASADQLGKLSPGIGHLVHMPSHIFQRLGRYQESITANQAAIAADRIYIAQTPATPEYRHGYLLHNYHYLWSSSVLAGQQKLALQTAQAIADQVNPTELTQGSHQNFYTLPLYTMIRFEQWSAILAAPNSQPTLPYVKAVWHYARGKALANTGNLPAARQEMATLKSFETQPTLIDLKIWDQPATQFLQVIEADLAGTIALQTGKLTEAIAAYTQAVEASDQLSYGEMGNWFAFIRDGLGRSLLKAGRPQEAETVFWQGLSEYPDNGWSLFGLVASLKAQGKYAEAVAMQERFEAAWKQADVQLDLLRYTSSTR